MAIIQNITHLIFLVSFIILFFYLMRRSKTNTPWIREPAAIQAIAEGIGRASEMGRPILVTTGRGTMFEFKSSASQTASYSIISYIAKIAAQQGGRVIAGVYGGQNMPYMEETLHQGRIEAGVSPEVEASWEVRFMGAAIFSYASAMLEAILRDKPAAMFAFGAMFDESLIFLGVGRREGVFQIFGSDTTSNQCWWAALSDYMMWHEDMYVAGALLRKDKEMMYTIIGQDVLRLVVIAIMVLGIVLKFGFNYSIVNIFNL